MYERINITEKRSKVKSQNRLPKIQRKKDYSKSMNSPVDRILFLQRTAGNQAVQRLIKSGSLQAKLKIGQPGDTYEQEADRVAEQVMRMPEPQAISSSTPYINSIQRASPGCEDEVLKRQPIEEEEELRRQPIEEEEEEELQAKANSDGISEVNPDIESHIQNMRGGGQPLPESTRAFFEPRFGKDFSQVRVHSDAKAAESAQAVNSKAFTVGQDVVFGRGQYVPETSVGKRLLAHELTHVIQQKGIYYAKKDLSRASTIKAEQFKYTNLDNYRPNTISNRMANVGIIQRSIEILIPILLEYMTDQDRTTNQDRVSNLRAQIRQLKIRIQRSRVIHFSDSGWSRLTRLSQRLIAVLPFPVPALSRAVSSLLSRQGIIAIASVLVLVPIIAALVAALEIVIVAMLIVVSIIVLVMIILAIIEAIQEALRRTSVCDEQLLRCLENVWQPNWNRDYGRRKDCGACNRECKLAGGIWPYYKCPD
ncbi:MAG: DUF4157 domain-containing protein [Deltaproteobacteria bacterium]|nr:DUF4157 domain-containing protein [Deltaproteobacteria bacterium]